MKRILEQNMEMVDVVYYYFVWESFTILEEPDKVHYNYKEFREPYLLISRQAALEFYHKRKNELKGRSSILSDPNHSSQDIVHLTLVKYYPELDHEIFYELTSENEYIIRKNREYEKAILLMLGKIDNVNPIA